MNLLDVRTVMISYAVSNAICAVVMYLLWRRSRGRFSGTGLWMADYLMQLAAVLLILLRGAIPESVSVMLGNPIVLAGTILLYIGLERFTGRRGVQIQNAFLLAAFVAVHAYYSFVTPSLTARNINFSLALLIICAQCAWLLLRRSDPDMRSDTRSAGWVFAAYSLASLIRIVADLAVPSGNDFFRSNVYDTLVLLTYQMLFIALTFSLFLMVNRRLFGDLEHDIGVRKRVEDALRISEEKFSKAFHSSPDAVLISRARDGKLLDVNEGFCRLTGYTREEALAGSSILLSLWVNPQDRETCVASLRTDRSIQNQEYDFRSKSGAVLHCLYSGELIDLAGEAHILSVVRDITERKNAEETLRRSEANFREVFDNAAQGIFIVDVMQDGSFRTGESNPAEEALSGFPGEAVQGKTLAEAFPAERTRELRGRYLRCLEAGTTTAFDETLDLAAGRRTIHTTLAPVRDETGRIYRIIGSTLDITGRKRVEDILRLRLNLWEYAATHTVDELMQKALDEIEGITSSPVSFYHFVEADGKNLALQAWSTRTLREFCTAAGKGSHYGLDRAGVWADSVRLGKPVIHNDYASLPGRKGMPEGHAQIVRELVVPTLRAGRVVSVLGVGNKPSVYDEQDAELLSYIADIIWKIVDGKRSEEEILRLQARLREMAFHDSLTGLYNRHYMEPTLKRELARAAREKYPASFIMIDIDHFKQVNDAFGHKAGDAVLQDLAGLLQKNSRASDIVYRYGGEEFLAVLPKVKADSALRIAEKWRNNFLKSTLLLEYGGVKVTLSCGIAAFPEHGTTAADLIACADKALYQAKEAGRNRSTIWKKPARRSKEKRQARSQK
jgi:diguanylate cyclase (GGDEF)-like protein/PAS domain S-box-containing protein